MKPHCLALLLISAALLPAQDRRVGTVDFFGYSGLDLKHLRETFPVKEGDPEPTREARNTMALAFAKAIGRSPVAVEDVCCLEDGRTSLFVGMPEPGIPPLALHPKPTGAARLSPDIVQISRDLDREIGIGVGKGQAAEDDSKGYALSSYEPARILELKLRDYAVAHLDNLIQVLHDAPGDGQRAAAAEAVGYADESPARIDALVYASLDSNSEVRNNAIRALGVLARYDRAAIKQIPLAPYIALLHSPSWTDRNKSMALIDQLTETRDPSVLRTLREQALVPLKEAAVWRDTNHAIDALLSLGRIAGIEEQRLLRLVFSKDTAAVLNSFQ
jgi:hypothetical protein